MSPRGRKKAWELIPVVTYSAGLVHSPRDAVLHAGGLSPALPGALCLGDVITTVEGNRPDHSRVHFLVA